MTAPSKLAQVLQIAERTCRTVEPERQQGREEFERREARDRRRDNLQRANPAITERDYKLLISGDLDFQSYEAMVATQRWLERTDEKRSFLFLGGSVGRGKTLAPLWHLANHGGAYVTESSLPRLVWDGAPELRARFLILDQVGDKVSEHNQQALFELVNERQRPGFQTVIIGNGDANMLPRLYPSPAMWSRLRRLSTWFTTTGPDMRRQP